MVITTPELGNVRDNDPWKDPYLSWGHMTSFRPVSPLLYSSNTYLSS